MEAPERVLTTFNHQEPDKVPMFESTFTNDAIFNYYGIKAGHLGPLFKLLKYVPFKHKIINLTLEKPKLVRKGLEPLAGLYRKAGIDMFPTISALFPRKILKDGFVDEFGRHMHFEYYKDGTEIIGYVEGYFDNFEDYENWVQPNPQWKARTANFEAGIKLQEEMNNEIFCIPGISGLMECTWEGFGIKTFSRILRKRPQAKKVFDDRGKFSLELTKILCEKGAKVVLIFDDYAFKNGPFMSPKNYKEYVFPWLRDICHAAHKRDCKILLHSDGDLTSLLHDLVNFCKIDGLNPIEPTTSNPEYNIFNVHEQHGDDITLVGNVPPNLLATGEPYEVRAYVENLIEKLGPGGGYVLASGHSINPAVLPKNWTSMKTSRDEFGQYPLS